MIDQRQLYRGMGIYKIMCEETGKVYIGSSSNIYHRWRTHKSDLMKNRHGNPHFQYAWNKYGENSFTLSVIERVKNRDYLWKRESFWIEQYNSTSPKSGFNLVLNPCAVGINVHTSKLTEQQVIRIKNILMNGKKTHKEIAQKFGVSRSAISCIARKETWGHILPDMHLETRKPLYRGQSRLSPVEVKSIRKCLEAGKLTIQEIATKFETSSTAVNGILHGQSFKRILSPTPIYRIPITTKGERHPNAKLTNKKVQSIRNFLRLGTKEVDIAKRYRVSPATIYMIAQNKIWK